MVTREDVVAKAVSQNGQLDGHGYGVANPYSAYLGRGPEQYCGDGVTWSFAASGLALPSMQVGEKTGFSFCPEAWNNTSNIHAKSWESQPADIAMFDWNGDGIPDHTEIVIKYENNYLFTEGFNSGPSNVDRFRGQGGVHEHEWYAPPSVGNIDILGIIKSGSLVKFGADSPPPPKPIGAPAYPILSLKSPNIRNQHVKLVQIRLKADGFWNATPDGIYNQTTRGAVYNWQGHHGLPQTGIVDHATYTKMGINVPLS